ncbi:OprD family porin [Pseudomonas fontis]|uniref:OprD family porin n=1 Tax=Pseudomonas fontis TaxID=2942633 RepID=A0ABT5NZ77_9PSED|nr:OprD family porin [Pseudomonas fontis]MDD0976726.1 OprD family porin [Pseudomonas fontis]MDD0993491.1 OprD family porin [Pseudomonas fontis]
MYKSTLAIAVAVGVLAQQAGAAGFVEDSKASVTARNFYINQDNRNNLAGSTNNKPSKQEEWGQGFIFNFTSGYTQGTVGFGIDAIGLAGFRLDSGKGTAYNKNSVNKGGLVFPSDSDGRAVEDFSSLGLTGKVKFSKTVAQIGTLMPKLPVVNYNDGRLLPQTFEGGQITSNEIDNLTLVGGKLEHAKGRNSTNNESLAIAGAGGAAGVRSNAFYYAGADYKITKDLLAQYYYGNLDDFYKQHFLGLTHNLALPVGSLKSDLRYFYSDSDGKNASAEGRLAGYKASGYQNNGEVDNRTWSAKFTYSLQGHALSAGYQRINGTSDFPFLNQGDGSSSYLITDVQIGKFQRAGERTWLAQYAYDFAAIGVPGLTTSVIYLKGTNINAAQSDRSEWERDFTLGYVIPEGTLKGLGLAWRNASLRSEAAGQRDQDENRLIVSYTYNFL